MFFENFDFTSIPYAVRFLMVFGASFLSDICWAFYFIKIASQKAIAAGLWGASVIILGSMITISFVDDHTLLIPSVLGAFVGTFLTVKYSKKEEQK